MNEPERNESLDDIDDEPTDEPVSWESFLEELQLAWALNGLWKDAPSDASPAPSRRDFPHIDRFQILRELGHGGFGMVLQARDTAMDRMVALKIPHPECLIDRRNRERFLREAKLASWLDHPHIVTVYEAGELGPILYIAAHFIDGPNLTEWLRSNPDGIDLRTAVLIAFQLTRAVHHAHQKGVLHRDVKPSNVLLDTEVDFHSTHGGKSPWAYLTDFGLAKSMENRQTNGQSCLLAGTPEYMAPEQAGGASAVLDPRTDVYSLGAVLFEMITGSPPFVAQSAFEVTKLVLESPAPSARRRRPEVSPDLDAICAKCLEKRPEQRYSSALELAEDLQRWLSGQPVQARPIHPSIRLARWARRHPLVTATSTALLAAILLGVSGIVWQWGEAKQNLHVAEAHLQRFHDASIQLASALDDLVWLHQRQDSWSDGFGIEEFELSRRLQQYFDIVDRIDSKWTSPALQAISNEFQALQAYHNQDYATARRWLARVLPHRRLVFEQAPRVTDGARQFAATLGLEADSLARLGRYEEAKGILLDAIRVLETSASSNPDDARLLLVFDHINYTFGLIARRQGQTEEAEKHLAKSIWACGELIRLFPEVPSHREAMIRRLHSASIIADDQRDFMRSVDLTGRALQHADSLYNAIVTENRFIYTSMFARLTYARSLLAANRTVDAVSTVITLPEIPAHAPSDHTYFNPRRVADLMKVLSKKFLKADENQVSLALRKQADELRSSAP